MSAHIKEFFKKETVLCIAAVCAVLTMFFVPPDAGYMGYIDMRVLCLLLCLMAVVEGFQNCGVFRWLAFRLLEKSKNGKTLGFILVMLPFFSSMMVTNDVALLTFVPFTLMLLGQIGCQSSIIPVLVLQTVAANLGSMATQVGNPQNLYLYSAYSLSAGEFFSVTLPLTAISFVLLGAASIKALPAELPGFELERETLGDTKKLTVYAVLFLLCLLTVFRLLPYPLLTVLVLVVFAIMQPKLLKKLDIALLATFVCFFVVSGNLGRVEAVRSFLQSLLQRNTLITSAAASQVISNVPAAVLLSGFTDQWRELLEGVNIGGLGTPIASLASLITLKIYLRSKDADALKFLSVFTVVNVAGLVILLAVAMAF